MGEERREGGKIERMRPITPSSSSSRSLPFLSSFSFPSTSFLSLLLLPLRAVSESVRRAGEGGSEGGKAGLNLTVNDRTPFPPSLLLLLLLLSNNNSEVRLLRSPCLGAQTETEVWVSPNNSTENMTDQRTFAYTVPANGEYQTIGV